MRKTFCTKFLLACIILCISTNFVFSQDSVKDVVGPDTVTFSSGSLTLTGLLWKPTGTGPFPAVLYNHGSEARPERFLTKLPIAFLSHGYALFVPFRRGQGFSKGQGRYITEELDSITKAGGQEARFKAVISLHETSQLQDQTAALEFLKAQPSIDSTRIVVVGISFGGIQTILMAGQPTGIRAALVFAGAAMIWEKSPEIPVWLKQSVRKIKVPVYFIQAENDFSIKPSLVLSEEMKRLGKPCEVKIYPPNGKTPMEGHAFIDAYTVWGPDVFPQLDKWIGKK
jgi:dienelactone hydrolase